MNDWGLGTALYWQSDSLRLGHSGKNVGYTNRFDAFAYKRNAVVIMTNGDNGGPLIDEIERTVSTYYSWGINDYKTVHPVPLTRDQKSRFVGNYEYREGAESIIVYIELENDTLHFIDSTFQVFSLLIPISNKEFVSDWYQFEVDFEYDSLGKVTGFALDHKWIHSKISK